MPGSEETYTDSQIVLARLSTNTLVEAAATLGCSERTLRRRLKEPDVVAMVDAARWDSVEKGLATMQAEYPLMVKVLADTAKDEKLDIKLRCTQAARLIELTLRATTLFDLQMKQEDA